MKERLREVCNRYLLLLGILVLAVLFLIIGLMIGYALIGDGKNPFDILSPSKWSQLIKVFRGE